MKILFRGFSFSLDRCRPFLWSFYDDLCAASFLSRDRRRYFYIMKRVFRRSRLPWLIIIYWIALKALFYRMFTALLINDLCADPLQGLILRAFYKYIIIKLSFMTLVSILCIPCPVWYTAFLYFSFHFIMLLLYFMKRPPRLGLKAVFYLLLFSCYRSRIVFNRLARANFSKIKSRIYAVFRRFTPID